MDWIDYNEYEKDVDILHDIIDSEKHGQKINILEKFQENLAYLNKTIEYVKNFDCQVRLFAEHHKTSFFKLRLLIRSHLT